MTTPPRAIANEILRWVLTPAFVVGLYIAAYLLTTEVFYGRLGSTRYRIRLFQSAGHQCVFFPLLSAEQRLLPRTLEFSGQVRSGASLPPHGDE